MPTRSFEYNWYKQLSQLERKIKLQPLNLGGITSSGGGVGGPPGGFIGLLPQTRVAYDTDEFETMAVPSGATLIDNLNHIRYRIAELEENPTGIIIEEDDVFVASGITTVNFEGSVSVAQDSTDQVTVTVFGSGGSLTVQDQDITLEGINTVTFSGATIADLGDGEVLVTISGSSVDGDSYEYWDINKPPESPNALDDEFDDSSFNTSLWSEFDPGGVLTIEEVDRGLKLTNSSNNGYYAGIYQPIASLSFPCTIWIGKISMLGIDSNETRVGFFLGEDLVSNPTTSNLYFYGVKTWGTGLGLVSFDNLTSYADTASYTSQLTTVGVGVLGGYIRVRMTSSTAFRVDFSSDGRAWHTWKNISSLSFTPQQFGILTYCPSSTTPAITYLDWFRVTSSASVDQSMGGMASTGGSYASSTYALSVGELSSVAITDVDTITFSGAAVTNLGNGEVLVVPSGLFPTGGFGTPPNYVEFDNTGHMVMYGNARPWRDQLSDAVSLQQVGTGVSRNSSEGTVEFSTLANLSDYMYANIQLNHDRDLTAPLYPHIHWFQAENHTPNFLLQYRWQVNGGLKTTSWTNLKCNSLAFSYSSGTLNQICYSSPIAVPSGSDVSDNIQFRILRDNANTSTEFTGSDAYTATVGVIAFDIHFQINTLGSDNEYEK